MGHSVFDQSDVQAIQRNEYYQGEFSLSNEDTYIGVLDDLIIEWWKKNENLKTDESWPIEDADAGLKLSNEKMFEICFPAPLEDSKAVNRVCASFFKDGKEISAVKFTPDG